MTQVAIFMGLSDDNAGRAVHDAEHAANAWIAEQAEVSGSFEVKAILPTHVAVVQSEYSGVEHTYSLCVVYQK